MTKAQIAEALKQLLAKASDSYYNTDKYLKVKVASIPEEVADYLLNAYVAKGKLDMYEPINVRTFEFTDEEFDRLEKVVKVLDPKWERPTGAPIKNEKIKEELPIPIFSLNKVHGTDNSIHKFSIKYKGPYVVSDKLDGNSLEIVYEDGKPTAAYTRGDAYTGGNVSYLIPHMDIPKTIKAKQRLIIRFEGVMPEAEFKKWANKYKNARNLTSGVFNKHSAHEAIEDIHVIAHSLLEPASKSPSDSFIFLKSLGFKVVWHSKVQQITGSSLSALFRQRIEKSAYKIDGLVITQDKPHALVEGNPPYSVAFKEAGEDNFAETGVRGIEWNASKNGLLIPTVLLEPVTLEGVTVSRAAGFNAKYIVKNKVGKGAVVTIQRSGDVIPDIQEVIKPAVKADLPSRSEFGDYEWLKPKNTHFILTNPHENIDVAVRRMYTFLADGLHIEEIGAATVQKMYDHGITTIEDILDSTVDDFMGMGGVQKKSATKYYNEIQKRLHSVNFVDALANSGKLGPNVGSLKLQKIEDQIGLEKLAKLPLNQRLAAIVDLHSFQLKTAKPIAEKLPEAIKWLKSLGLTFVKPTKIKQVGNKLQGKGVVFTGFRDKAMEERIKAQGGLIQGSVNKDTVAVIASDPSDNKAKAAKARSLGIPVIGKLQFEKKYL